MSRVVLPVLSRAQDDDRAYLRYFLKIQLAVCCCLGLGFALLAGTAVPLTAVLLGSSWQGVAPVLAVLAVGGIFKGMDAASYQIWVSRNVTGSLFRFYLISRPIMILVILAGLPWGPVGVATGHLVAAVGNWMVGTRLACHYAKLPPRPVIAQPLRVLVVVALPGGLASYAGTLVPGPALLQVCTGLAAGVCAAALVSILVAPLRRDLAPLLRGVRSAAHR